MKKKRALTLLEIMIVIFLITLITGAIGYNMRGSLDRGKRFRTEQAIAQLKDLLQLCMVETGKDAATIAGKPEKYLTDSGLAKDPKGLLKDGWGDALEITVSDGDFEIASKHMPK